MKTALVTLKVTWDETEYGPSCRTWDWGSLVDTDDPENVQVVDYEEISS